MHDTSRLSDPDARDLTAGEYVLGVLDRHSRAEFEALMAVSPETQRCVEAWREHLQLFNDRLEPVSPPRNVWSLIKAQLGTSSRGWQRLGLWQGFSAIATAAAIGLAILLTLPSPAEMMPGDYVLVIQDESQRPGWIVNASHEGGVMIQAVEPGPMPADKACELWMMDNGTPVSLGMLPNEGQMTMQLPEHMRAQLNTADLAVSIEPSSGAPEGKPSGPIMDSGKLTPIRGRIVSL